MTLIRSRGVPWRTSSPAMCVRRHQDPVGQGDVAEPALVEPVEFAQVEPAVAEVDREEVGRLLGFDGEDVLLLADVAVDHAQDRRDAQAAAGGQRQVRPDIAEQQRQPGTTALDRPRHRVGRTAGSATGPPDAATPGLRAASFASSCNAAS